MIRYRYDDVIIVSTLNAHSGVIRTEVRYSSYLNIIRELSPAFTVCLHFVVMFVSKRRFMLELCGGGGRPLQRTEQYYGAIVFQRYVERWYELFEFLYIFFFRSCLYTESYNHLVMKDEHYDFHLKMFYLLIITTLGFINFRIELNEFFLLNLQML